MSFERGDIVRINDPGHPDHDLEGPAHSAPFESNSKILVFTRPKVGLFIEPSKCVLVRKKDDRGMQVA